MEMRSFQFKDRGISVPSGSWSLSTPPTHFAPDSSSNKDDSNNDKLFAAGMNGVRLPVCTNMRTSLTKEAKAAKFHGVVLVAAIVELDGRITHIKSAGLGLNKSAISALKKWKCKPAMKDGKPVLTETPFQFSFDSNWPNPLESTSASPGPHIGPGTQWLADATREPREVILRGNA
jgi:Gram-negative bacterial TonB protein C-terminal